MKPCNLDTDGILNQWDKAMKQKVKISPKQEKIFSKNFFKFNISLYKKWQGFCLVTFAGTSQRTLELGWLTISNFNENK